MWSPRKLSNFGVIVLSNERYSTKSDIEMQGKDLKEPQEQIVQHHHQDTHASKVMQFLWYWRYYALRLQLTGMTFVGVVVCIIFCWNSTFFLVVNPLTQDPKKRKTSNKYITGGGLDWSVNQIANVEQCDRSTFSFINLLQTELV